jgi:hypothetical protein
MWAVGRRGHAKLTGAGVACRKPRVPGRQNFHHESIPGQKAPVLFFS